MLPSTPMRPRPRRAVDDAQTVLVEIRDDGRGGATLTGGTGIRGLADRIEALGGQFKSRAPQAPAP